MATEEPGRCPTCGATPVDDILDEVEGRVDSLFDDLANAPLRISLDDEPDADNINRAVSLPEHDAAELEETLAALAHALMVLQGAVDRSQEDLHTLIRALAADADRWAARLRDRQG